MVYPWDFSTPIWYEWYDRYPLFTPEPGHMYGDIFVPGDDPPGTIYGEYYLYANKAWEMAPSGVSSINLQNAIYQNAPIVITPSGMETTNPEDPWARVSGTEKYQKVGYGYFDLLAGGQYDPDAIQFSMSPDASGTIIFNGPLKENVYIEYESGGESYYIMDTVDYNPIRNEVSSGFVHFSETTEPTAIDLVASNSYIKADGHQGCILSAILYDKDYDRVPYADIIFEMQELEPAASGGYYSVLGGLSPTVGSVLEIDASGVCTSVMETTNLRGEAYATYISNYGKNGIVSIKAYYALASGIYNEVVAYQYFLSIAESEPFVLDVSQLNTMSYLTE
jgi:hypothetical protein